MKEKSVKVILIYCDRCEEPYAITYPFKFFKSENEDFRSNFLIICNNCFEDGNYPPDYIEITYEEKFSKALRKNYRDRKFFNDY